MKFTSIESSTIKAVAHANNTLYLEFHSGHCYKYGNITQIQYKELMQAKSAGKYFASSVKKFNVDHPYMRLSQQELRLLKEEN